MSWLLKVLAGCETHSDPTVSPQLVRGPLPVLDPPKRVAGGWYLYARWVLPEQAGSRRRNSWPREKVGTPTGRDSPDSFRLPGRAGRLRGPVDTRRGVGEAFPRLREGGPGPGSRH